VTTSQPGPDPSDEIDVLLRKALRDDLPPAVEARMERRLQRFLVAHAEPRHGVLARLERLRLRARIPRAGAWVPGRLASALASALLLASGFALNAALGPGVFAQSLSQVNASVSLSSAIAMASSMSCTGMTDGELVSASALADRIYRKWVLIRSVHDAAGATVLVFRAPDEPALYELVTDAGSLLPREIRKRVPADATHGERASRGYSSRCAWKVEPAARSGVLAVTAR